MTQSSPGWAVACCAGQGHWVNVTLLQVDPLRVFITRGGSTLRPLARCQLSKENLLWDTVLWHTWPLSRNASIPVVPQIWSTSVLVTLSRHFIPAILRKQRRWNWSCSIWIERRYKVQVSQPCNRVVRNSVYTTTALYTATLVFLDMSRSPHNLRCSLPNALPALARLDAMSAWTTNLVYFSLKICHLVATVLKIFLRINYSRILCTCNYRKGKFGTY